MSDIPLDRALLTGMIATAGVLVLMPLLIRAAPRLGMVDDPTRDTRRVHINPIPRVGGVAVAVVLALALAVQAQPLDGTVWLLAGLAVLLGAGIIDDRGSLPPAPKLLAQAVAVALAMAGGWILPSVPIPLLGIELTATWATWPVTLVLGLGLINATNLIDGLDGLAAGIGCVTALAFAAMAGMSGDVPACIASTALAGCLVGTLAFNSHPARVFLGDTGSMIIGFMLHVLGLALIRGHPGGDPGLSPFVVLLVLVIPWADSAYVMLSRLLHGGNPFRGDKTHVHHQVLGLGFDHRMAVITLVSLSAAIACLAVLLRRHPHDTLFLLTLLCAQSVIFGLRYLRRSRVWSRLSLRLERMRRERNTARIEAAGHPGGRPIAAVVGVLAIALAAAHVPALARHAPLSGLAAAAGVALVLTVLATTRRWDNHVTSIMAAMCGGVLAFAVESGHWHASDVDGRGLQTIYLVRSLTAALFVAALLLLWLRRRLHLLIDGPVDLVLIAVAASTVWLARDRLALPPNAIIAPALAWYLACKACAGEEGWRKWLVPATVTAAGAIFAGWQLLRG